MKKTTKKSMTPIQKARLSAQLHLQAYDVGKASALAKRQRIINNRKSGGK